MLNFESVQVSEPCMALLLKCEKQKTCFLPSKVTEKRCLMSFLYLKLIMITDEET